MLTYIVHGLEIAVDMCKHIANATAYLSVYTDTLDTILSKINAWSQHSIETGQITHGRIDLGIAPTPEQYINMFLSLIRSVQVYKQLVNGQT